MQEKPRLFFKMLARGLAGFVLLGLLLFVSAGSPRYSGAWVFLITLAALMLAMGVLLLVREPETLKRRMKTRERERAQRGYMGIIGLLFLACFLLAGLDHRFGWSAVPVWVTVPALAVMVGGYAMYAAVTLQNAYAGRVVEVQEGQKVISTRLYGLVRHPMYLASLLLFWAMPIVLGSYVAFLPMLAYPFMLGLRIKNEEQVLAGELAGYRDYMQRTRFRLIPFIW